MRLNPLVWQCGDHTHDVVRVDFDAADIREADRIGRLKVPYMNNHDPAGIPRPPEVVRIRAVAGKLADAAFREHVQAQIIAQGLGLHVEEYDAIRTDNFQHGDLYDFRILDGGQERFVEVRSSFSYRVPAAERIVRSLSIYGWYVTAHHSEPHRDFYWQFMWYWRPQNKPRQPKWPNVPIFEDQLNAGAVHGYLVGGATRDMLDDPAISSVRADQDGADYQAVCPICRGYDVPAITRLTLA